MRDGEVCMGVWWGWAGLGGGGWEGGGSGGTCIHETMLEGSLRRAGWKRRGDE